MEKIISIRLGWGGWIVVVLTSFLFYNSCIPDNSISPGYPSDELSLLGFDGFTYHGKKFTVVNIVDGDTLDIDYPDGDKDFTRIRLLGVDTPETKHPRIPVMYYGPEATAFVEQLAGSRKVTIVLDPTKPTRGKYGRLLAYIYLPDGRCLNEELILDGFAYAYLPYRHQHSDLYLVMQLQAMTQKKGLWANVTRKQLPQWLQDANPTLLED